MVDGLAVLWEEVLEFVGSKVSNKCLAKWRPVLKSSWLTQNVALEHCKDYNVAGLSF